MTQTEKQKVKILSPRELQCMELLAQGLRSEAIAHKLLIKRVTVDLHLANAKRKLKAATREQAVAIAVKNKMINP